jgi:hypothetical protein
MFGKKRVAAKNTGGTVLILDIESGSVATALVDVAKQVPQIVSYQRQQLPLNQSRSGAEISRTLEQTLTHSLRHSAEVAARMRVHAPGQGVGKVGKVVVFLAAPWGSPNLTEGAPQYAPGIRQYIKKAVEAAFGDLPISFYTAADALLYGSRTLGKHIDTIAVSLRGEMLELLLLNDGATQGYSTVPLGSRSILRTLQTHGGLSEHEARSMLTLTKHTDDWQYEPLLAAGRHLSDSFADGVELLLPAGTASSLVVVSEQPLGEWFAKSIADNPRIANLFSEESTVEALLPFQLKDHVDHGAVHDPFVLLEALLVGDK